MKINHPVTEKGEGEQKLKKKQTNEQAAIDFVVYRVYVNSEMGREWGEKKRMVERTFSEKKAKWT
jgi:hypothetical protein